MESFSSRIIKFSKAHDFVGNKGESHFSVEADQFKATFYFTANRGQLKEISYTVESERIENGILFALCTLLKNADTKRMKSITAREVESFLRDQNHIPAMGESPFPGAFVDSFRELLISSVFESEIRKDVDFWEVSEESSYVDKIKAISDFFTLKINMNEYFLEESMEIELIQLEDDAFFVEFRSSINHVKLAPNTLSKVFLDSLEGLVRSVIKSENINLVAE
ncbi:hypothetical protein [Halobacteriovorax sp. JY17]|uniref:hypothetical protein n=1 Tax=Halobacteriovorax sp. JY17 TaxID=2014617 RepID=UPI000C5DF471|nr:hypothetical protein [Halobacteriovorax sp. JY17]PIK16006.1 MAG: hypothetical protein CES88_04565 [Halobacteriovorax sp. JY17]